MSDAATSTPHYLFSPQRATLAHLERLLTPDRRNVAERILASLYVRSEPTISALEEEPFSFQSPWPNPSFHNNHLLVGERGSGKTHIFAYICKRLLNPAHNQSSIRVLMLPEDMRGASGLVDFVSFCITAFGGRLSEKTNLTSNNALEILDSFIGTEPTVIITENLSELFNRFDESEQEQLRLFFENHPGISFLASSVETSWLERLDHPFSEYFMVHSLLPLTYDGAVRYIKSLCGAHCDKHMAEGLEARKARPFLRALFELTQGNHRLLAMASQFIEPQRLTSLSEFFVAFVDHSLIPYFQSELDRLSPQQLKLLQAIAREGGRAITVNELAEQTALTSQTVSRQLHDLLAGGVVARYPVGRESFYEIQEPLLRFVLEIRQGYDPYPFATVELLRHWYWADEVAQRAAAPQDLRKSARTNYIAALEAVEHLALIPDYWGPTGSSQPGGGAYGPREAGLELFEAGVALFQDGNIEASLARFEGIARIGAEDMAAAFNRAALLTRLGRTQEAETVYKKILAQETANCAPEQLVALFHVQANYGIRLSMRGEHEAALGVYQQALAALVHSTNPQFEKVFAQLMLQCSITLSILGRWDDAVSAYDAMVKRFGGVTDPVTLGWVAAALVNKGKSLGDAGRLDEAVQVYGEVVHRFGENLPGAEVVALSNMALLLEAQDRWEDAVAVLNELISQCDDYGAADCDEQLALAFVQKGRLLHAHGRTREGMLALDELGQRFANHPDSYLIESIAKALVNTAASLRRMRRHLETLDACDTAIWILPNQIHALLLRTLALFDLYRDADGLEALTRFLGVAKPSSDIRADLLASALACLITRPETLKAVEAAFRDDTPALAAGLLGWFRANLPQDTVGADAMTTSENVLRVIFSSHLELQPVFEMLASVRRHVQGDNRALYRIPVELRRVLLEKISLNH